MSENIRSLSDSYCRSRPRMSSRSLTRRCGSSMNATIFRSISVVDEITLQRQIWRKLNRLSGREYVVESHQAHLELTNGPRDLLGFPKLGSSWDQVQNCSQRAPPPVLMVCETDPAVCKKSVFQLCEFAKVQGDGEIDVSGMPGLRWKMYLVRNGPDDYKVCSEGRTTVLQDSEVSDLVVG